MDFSITEILKELQSNPAIGAGVGAAVVAGIFYQIRALPGKLWSNLRAAIISEIQITDHNCCYFEEIVGYYSKFGIPFFSRNYSVDDRGKVVFGYGRGIAIYKGVLIISNKNLMDNKMVSDQQFSMTFFSRNKSYIDNFVKEAIQDNDKNKESVRILIKQFGGGQISIRRPKRSLDTVFANAGVKENIIKKLDWFYANENWYLERGIIYKLCIALYGPPGTGKTSLIFALASKYQAHLHIINNIQDIAEVSRNIDFGVKNFIVVEDIDTLAQRLNRESEDKPDEDVIHSLTEEIEDALEHGDDTSVKYLRQQIEKEKQRVTRGEPKEVVTEKSLLHTLLNTLDGFETPWGITLFITTNHFERLDPALRRPGRIDMRQEILPLDRFEMKRMFGKFYPNEEVSCIDQYLDHHKFKPQTGAKLQELFLENNAHEATEKLLEEAK